MSVVAQLEKGRLRPEAETAALLESMDGDGAMVSFVGVARPQDRMGRPVERLFLEHHERLTEESLRDIAEEASARFEVSHVRVVHRCGEIGPGEPIVFAAASSAHRRAAFEAADYLMDRLKTEAVFWKREDRVDGSDWIEPTADDHAARGRWSDTWPE